MKWTKVVKTDKNGKFMQVGLPPVKYFIAVHADGYTDKDDKGPGSEGHKIPLADTYTINFTMYTQDELRALALPLMDPNAQLENQAVESLNAAIAKYNASEFEAALDPVMAAYDKFKEASTKAKDESEKKEIETRFPACERLYGLILYENAKEESHKDLPAKAVGPLTNAFGRNPKDVRVVAALVEVNKQLNDAAAVAKYQPILDSLIPPDPAKEYNEGVNEFNASHLPEAKAHLLKAIQMNPSFTESYYLLGLVEFSMNHNKDAKDNWKTYLEKDPNGKKAGEVKQFLKELK
jgi:tetratricopeptide (TPR) repeat protein